MRILLIALLGMFLVSCDQTQTNKDRKAVDNQQAIYATSQPVPKFKWSLERQLISELYQVRNMRASTHSVWRGDTSVIEGDCPSVGYGIPYDSSLTNPLKRVYSGHGAVVEQAEPNGIFASKNTAATWVLCVDGNGEITPIYVEAKVTTYPFPLKVDYDKNRVMPVKGSASSVTISASENKPTPSPVREIPVADNDEIPVE